MRTRKSNSEIEIYDLRTLRLLILIADHKSFRKAAEAAQLGQSALSRRIRSLEENIGVSFFERHSGGIHLTQAGAEFVNAISKALRQIDQAISIAGQAGHGAVGLLRIGMYTSLSRGTLHELLTEYIAEFPAVRLRIIEADANQLAAEIRSRSVDIAIVTRCFSTQSNIDVIDLWRERIMLALPQGHRLTHSQRILWRDLTDEKLILMRRDPGPQLLELINNQLNLPGGHKIIEQHDVSLDNLLSLVATGSGIAVLYESATGADFSSVLYRKLWDESMTGSVGYHACWSPSNDNPALRRFLSLLRKRYQPRNRLPKAGESEPRK